MILFFLVFSLDLGLGVNKRKRGGEKDREGERERCWTVFIQQITSGKINC